MKLLLPHIMFVVMPSVVSRHYQLPYNMKACMKQGYDNILYEPHHEKTGFLHMRKQRRSDSQISFAVTAKLISAFVFATQIVQSLYYLNPILQASSHLLWLYSPVCVGPGRKPRRPVFSRRGSYLFSLTNHVHIKLIVTLTF